MLNGEIPVHLASLTISSAVIFTLPQLTCRRWLTLIPANSANFSIDKFILAANAFTFIFIVSSIRSPLSMRNGVLHRKYSICNYLLHVNNYFVII